LNSQPDSIFGSANALITPNGIPVEALGSRSGSCFDGIIVRRFEQTRSSPWRRARLIRGVHALRRGRVELGDGTVQSLGPDDIRS
jgi:hypothetical protein